MLVYMYKEDTVLTQAPGSCRAWCMSTHRLKAGQDLVEKLSVSSFRQFSFSLAGPALILCQALSIGRRMDRTTPLRSWMGACPSAKHIAPPPTNPPCPPCEFMVIFACRPIQQRERQLVDSGPTWRAPSVAGVLRNLPFMRHAPPQVLEVYPHTLQPLPLSPAPPSPTHFLYVVHVLQHINNSS